MAKTFDIDCKDNLITVINDAGKISEFVYVPTAEDVIPRIDITKKEALATAKKFGCSDNKIEKIGSWLSSK